ncbi:YolD-like family protein [Rubeoparvulum massiliense]|uniref:YolD-like family protein n=1 Tax=Rubeoparvulum massiliense TaxID=1631346 RepID=UPI00065E7332|nr:YolD-like family protein [Rubeoparvulum massiliense]
MIRDRGAKKWVSLMLPEHREQLARLARQEELISEPAWVDEYLEELEWKVQTAYAQHRFIRLEYVVDGERRTQQGLITALDPLLGQVRIETEGVERSWVSVRSIISLEWV